MDAERATAEGVIYNRLKENMSLGIDATVLYAVGKTSGELTTAELETDSPYNTRKNKGLPAKYIQTPENPRLRQHCILRIMTICIMLWRQWEG